MSDADDAFGTDAFGAPDPDEQPGGRRRRGPLVAVAVAVAAAAVVGLLVWQPWSNDEAATPTTVVPSLSAELVIDLSGLTLERSSEASDDFREVTDRQGFIFAAPEASLDEGPLLAFLVQPLVGGEEIDNSSASLEIDGQPATVEESVGSVEIWWEGEPGVRYGVAGPGMSTAQVIAFAQSVSYEGDITTVDDPEAIEGLQPAGEVADLWRILGLTQPRFATEAGSFSIVYTTEQGTEITLASVAAPPDFEGLAALILSDDRVIEVDGEQVLVGTLSETFGDGGDAVSVLFAVRGGRLIGITATDVDDNGLLALLAAVRPATDDEWEEVQRVVEDPFDNLGGNDVVEEATVPATALPDDTEP